MIIEQINIIRDLIIKHQSYFHKGFADVKLIEYSERKGLFVEDEAGEHEYALTLDYNSFYLRRINNINMTGQPASGMNVTVNMRLIAQASNADKYKMLECLTSVLISPCGTNGVTNIELNVERILRNEGISVDTIKTLLSRCHKKQFVQIDFSFSETFEPIDIQKCNCNPCINC